LPGVDSSFNLSYNYPLIAMMGMVSQLNTTFNYDKNGNALPIGAPVKRRYGADEYELYVQDAFRLRPNLTITTDCGTLCSRHLGKRAEPR
jgi:hypothetical protein